MSLRKLSTSLRKLSTSLVVLHQSTHFIVLAANAPMCDAGSVRLDCFTGGAVIESNEAVNTAL